MKKRFLEGIIVVGIIVVVVLSGLRAGNSPGSSVASPNSTNFSGESVPQASTPGQRQETVSEQEGTLKGEETVASESALQNPTNGNVPEQTEEAFYGEPVFDRTIPVLLDEDGIIHEQKIPEWDYHYNKAHLRISRNYTVEITQERAKKWNEWDNANTMILAIDPNHFFSVGDMLLYEQSDFHTYLAFCVKNISLIQSFSVGNGIFIDSASKDYTGEEVVSAGSFYYKDDTQQELYSYEFLDVEISVINRLNASQLCMYRYPTLIFEEDYEGEKITTGYGNMVLQGKEGLYGMHNPIFVDSPEMTGNSFYRMAEKEEKTYHVIFVVDPNHLDTMILNVNPTSMRYSYSADTFLIRVSDYLP